VAKKPPGRLHSWDYVSDVETMICLECFAKIRCYFEYQNLGQ